MESFSNLISEMQIDDMCAEESTPTCPLSPALLPSEAPLHILESIEHFLLEESQEAETPKATPKKLRGRRIIRKVKKSPRKGSQQTNVG